jgi:hypothetical protein
LEARIYKGDDMKVVIDTEDYITSVKAATEDVLTSYFNKQLADLEFLLNAMSPSDALEYAEGLAAGRIYITSGLTSTPALGTGTVAAAPAVALPAPTAPTATTVKDAMLVFAAAAGVDPGRLADLLDLLDDNTKLGMAIDAANGKMVLKADLDAANGAKATVETANANLTKRLTEIAAVLGSGVTLDDLLDSTTYKARVASAKTTTTVAGLDAAGKKVVKDLTDALLAALPTKIGLTTKGTVESVLASSKVSKTAIDAAAALAM